MNKFIKQQLLKTKIALPHFDDNTTQLTIKKNSQLVQTSSSDLEIGRCYLIYIEGYIINEPENFALSVNWNNGTKPIEQKCQATIKQIMGKMVKVDTIGFETGTQWNGWLPRKSFYIIEEDN